MSKTTPDDVCALCYHHKSEAATCNREDCELSPASPCYALVLYSYDYYEWETTKAVSFDRQQLKKEHKVQDCLYSDRPLIALKEHRFYAKMEEAHWVIQPVKFLA